MSPCWRAQYYSEAPPVCRPVNGPNLLDMESSNLTAKVKNVGQGDWGRVVFQSQPTVLGGDGITDYVLT